MKKQSVSLAMLAVSLLSAGSIFGAAERHSIEINQIATRNPVDGVSIVNLEGNRPGSTEGSRIGDLLTIQSHDPLVNRLRNPLFLASDRPGHSRARHQWIRIIIGQGNTTHFITYSPREGEYVIETKYKPAREGENIDAIKNVPGDGPFTLFIDGDGTNPGDISLIPTAEFTPDAPPAYGSWW